MYKCLKEKESLGTTKRKKWPSSHFFHSVIRHASLSFKHLVYLPWAKLPEQQKAFVWHAVDVLSTHASEIVYQYRTSMWKQHILVMKRLTEPWVKLFFLRFALRLSTWMYSRSWKHTQTKKNALIPHFMPPTNMQRTRGFCSGWRWRVSRESPFTVAENQNSLRKCDYEWSKLLPPRVKKWPVIGNVITGWEHVHVVFYGTGRLRTCAMYWCSAAYCCAVSLNMSSPCAREYFFFNLHKHWTNNNKNKLTESWVELIVRLVLRVFSFLYRCCCKQIMWKRCVNFLIGRLYVTYCPYKSLSLPKHKNLSLTSPTCRNLYIATGSVYKQSKYR